MRDWSAEANDEFYTPRFIHRHYFMPVLARAYWATDDDKHVCQLVELWTDWIRRAPQAKKNEGLGPMYQALLQPAQSEEQSTQRPSPVSVLSVASRSRNPARAA